MVTVSTKRDRVYERAFDHEEAQRLRAEDPKRWTWPALAEYFGVTPKAVIRVCVPKVRDDMNRRAQEWMRNNRREPCKGGCGTLVWLQNSGRSGYCASCYAAGLTAADERDGELRCLKCGEWKPDADFYNERRPTRRGHKSWCRDCDNAARRKYRETHRDQERAYDNARKRKGLKMGDFVVLQKDESGYLKEYGRITAVSRLHAVEQIANAPGEYIVVKPDVLEPLHVEETVAFKVVKNGAGPE